MEKVLILSSKPPYPLRDGAAIRTYQSIYLFAKLGYIVDVLYLSEIDDEELVNDGLRNLCRHVYHFKITRKQSYFKVLKGIISNRLPLQVSYFYSRKVQRWINKNSYKYDIVYCNNIRTAQYARKLKNKKILDFVDAYSMNYQSARDNTTGKWHWIYTIDFPRCNKYEQKVLHEFDKCLIISEIDKQHILSQTTKPAEILVVENFTPIDEQKRIPTNENMHNIVFIGAMNYEPNVSAVKFFTKDIMPELIKQYSDIRFYIVGKTPTPEVKALADEHTIVTGFVESTWEYLKKASIVVTPMLTGSGLQNKILQALAVGACVVTTPKGFEGLVSDEGEPYVAESNEEMVRIITRLLINPEERRKRGDLSVAYVRKHYDVEVIKQKFANCLNA